MAKESIPVVNLQQPRFLKEIRELITGVATMSNAITQQVTTSTNNTNTILAQQAAALERIATAVEELRDCMCADVE